MNVHFSSKTDLWATPQDFFDKLNSKFRFTLDVCATDDNAKCANYFTKAVDGLKQKWTGRVWMNPPYGREIGAWVKKASDSVACGDADLVVALLPARVDTAWWHNYCYKQRFYFLRGRLKFGGHSNSAPFPSVVVIFTK